jgi:hypothetical protein
MRKQQFTLKAEINADDEYEFVIRFKGNAVRKFKNQKQAEDFLTILNR